MNTKKENSRYMIFRIYDEKERPSPERAIFYGWSYNRPIVDAFLIQRNKKKYKVTQMTDSDIASKFHEDILDSETMLDFIKLKSATSGEYTKLICTSRELMDAEILIQRYFGDLCSFENAPGEGHYVEMMLSLKDYYRDALEYIGFRPRDIDMMYPSADIADNYDDTENAELMLAEAYGDKYGFCMTPGLKLEGNTIFDDMFRKVIYSLENFIKVLRSDM